MDKFSSFDYLCNEPFFIDGIGHIRCPTLRDIRKITYRVFSLYVDMISVPLDQYLTLHGLKETYDSLPEPEKACHTLFRLLLYQNPRLLISILDFFLLEHIDLSQEEESFLIYKGEKDAGNVIGQINNENFETFRKLVQRILGFSDSGRQEPKFKNRLARSLYEKMQRHDGREKKNRDDNYSLANMVRKYCTHNKSGINILNVWDLTYYQFTQMFYEYCHARDCDLSYLMAANTFSYKKASDYKPLEYMQKLDIN